MFTKTHGLTNNPIYWIWRSMIKRCHSQTDPAYKHYGGRGVYVCNRWRNSVEAFYADMGDRPEGKSIDRIDNNGPYSPENCRWATDKVQNRNSRRAKLIAIGGESRCINDWLEKNGISYSLFKKRRKAGWATEKAVTEKPGNGSRLTSEQVKAIREDKRRQREIAGDYGITQTAVSAIKRGVNWRHA